MTNETQEIVSNWKGSTRTAAVVAAEIVKRWGAEEVKNYHPELNCFTYKGWDQRGYQVRRGEKSIQSVTFVPILGEKVIAGTKKEVQVSSFPRTVHLFYIKQVDKREVKAAA